MNFYFSPDQVPELSRLSTRQFDLVERDCLRPIRLRSAVRLAKFAFLFPLCFIAWAVVPELWSETWQSISCLVASLPVLYAADHMFDMAVLSPNRGRIAKFIFDHPQELQ